MSRPDHNRAFLLSEVELSAPIHFEPGRGIDFSPDAPSVKQENKLARMAQAIEFADPATIGAAIRALNQRLGLPAGLRETGVSAELFPRIASVEQGEIDCLDVGFQTRR